MALGTPVAGTAAVLMVGTTSGAITTPLGGQSTWDWVSDRPQTEHPYYGQATVISVGKASYNVTLNNDYETADSGHAILYAAYDSQATIYFKLLPDGTNGKYLPVKVGHQEIHGPDVNAHTTVNWTLAAQGDPVTVGTGFGT